MITKHTPGPWSAVLDDCPITQDRWIVEKREQGWKTFIAEVYANPEHPAGALWQGTKEANARLIAAAPDLLKALQTFLAFYDDLAKSNPGFMWKLCLQDYAQWNEALLQAPAAIAKATGKGAA